MTAQHGRLAPDEPLPPGPDHALVEDMVARARAQPARLGDARLICVDGPAGSGKSTMSRALEAAFCSHHVEVAVVHIDDLYQGWEGLNPDLEGRVLDQLLRPLAERHTARWQRYNWAEDRFSTWVDQPPSDILVLDGCGSGASAYDAYRSLLIWLEADPETRLARGLHRDGEQVLPRWLAWMESEQTHFTLNDTRHRADVRLSTSA